MDIYNDHISLKLPSEDLLEIAPMDVVRKAGNAIDLLEGLDTERLDIINEFHRIITDLRDALIKWQKDVEDKIVSSADGTSEIKADVLGELANINADMSLGEIARKTGELSQKTRPHIEKVLNTSCNEP